MRVLLGLVACWTLSAQPPAISQNGVVNAASQMPSALTGGAVARGARFLVRGVRLGTGVDGTRLLLIQGGRAIPVPLRSVREQEVEAHMRDDAPLGPGSLMVETPAGRSKAFSVRVVPSAPGLFTLLEQGWGQGLIEIGTSGGHPIRNSFYAPVRPNRVAVIDATGLGSAKTIEVIVGGIRARVLAVSRSLASGLDRIRFQVPSNAPEGCFVPVYVRVGTGPPSNVVTMAIDQEGSSCQLPIGGSPVLRPRMGLISIARTTALYADDYPPTVLEDALAAFAMLSPNFADSGLELSSLGSANGVSPIMLIPPAGTCTAFYGSSQWGIPTLTSLGDGLVSALRGHGLDAGRTLSIVGRSGSRIIPASPGEPGAYVARLGLIEPGKPPAPPLFLNDPEYTISSSGGPGVASFTAPLPAPPAFDWTNRGQLGVIDRAKGATFEWRGVPSDALVLILLGSPDTINAAGGVCYCAAKAENGHLTIPAEMLLNLPGTQPVPGPPQNLAFVIAARFSSAAPSTIGGLDELWTFSLFISGRRVTYR
jgi:uncharacterized protein (TIGR03437 family)